MSNGGNAKSLAQHFTPAAVAQLAWDAVRTLAGKELGAGARVIDPAAQPPSRGRRGVVGRGRTSLSDHGH